jgi:protein-export membrane protein SecD
MRNNIAVLAAVMLLFLASLYIALPVDHPSWLENAMAPGTETSRDLRNLTLGLDLEGGTQVLLEADIPEEQAVEEDALRSAQIIVEQRVNGLGVTEPNVQLQGDRRIVIELPGISNPEQAIETIRSTGQLEFVDPGNSPLGQGMIINTTNRPDAVERFTDNLDGRDFLPGQIPYPDQTFETVMTGDILRSALAVQNEFGQWQIQFDLTPSGSDQFYDYTRAHIGEPLVIVLDGRVLSAPIINAPIRDNGVIEGQFTQEEAESLGVQMRYGALPIPLEVVDVRTIGASLGQDSVDRSLRAGIIGMSMVLLFMLILYRLPGLLANLSLLMYMTLNITIYKLIPVTLTLPGIAGFLLSVGMAVDANILIFERMREELRSGRSLRLSVETGFSRAWPAIRDGNLSTLISCAVLYWFGNNFGASIVKGFAITLAVGVTISMFTAVFVTRTLMRTFLSRQGQRLLDRRSLLGY